MSSDAVVDLETLGIRPYSQILSIGVCAFQPKYHPAPPLLANQFYRVLAIEPQETLGLTTDQSVLDWWDKLKAEGHTACEVFTSAQVHPGVALEQLNKFLRSTGVTTLWGNGASFDLTLLECLYERCGIEPVITFRNYNDVRTIKRAVDLLRKEVAYAPRAGVPHHALHDAIHEAQQVQACVAALRS